MKLGNQSSTLNATYYIGALSSHNGNIIVVAQNQHTIAENVKQTITNNNRKNDVSERIKNIIVTSNNDDNNTRITIYID